MKKRIKLDVIVISALIFVGAGLALILFLGQKKGSVVQVRVSGDVVKEFAIDQDVEYDITGYDSSCNHLAIKGGKAWIEEASCPDGLCINMGTIDKVGQSVVCLPNQVVVEIVSADGSEKSDVDFKIG